MILSSDASLEQIAAAVERYLSLNPSAADSVIGIAQWWLPSFGLDAAPEKVERALLLLQARGVVEAVQVGDRQCFWRALAGNART